MKDLSLHDVLAIVLVIGICLFFLVPLAAVAPAYGWERLIREYQTLFTGILAVAAALFTIRQMRDSDRENERRHQEQLHLQLDSSKAPVFRAIWRVGPHARNAADTFGKLIQWYDRNHSNPVWDSRTQGLFIGSIFHCQRIIADLESDAVKSALPYFHPGVEELIEKCLDYGRAALPNAFENADIKGAYKLAMQVAPTGAPLHFSEYMLYPLGDLEEYLRELLKLFDAIAPGAADRAPLAVAPDLANNASPPRP